MKPILIFALGAGALWALMRGKEVIDGQGKVLPQNQKGISMFVPIFTPQQPQQVWAGLPVAPNASYPPGYQPPFGPNFQAGLTPTVYYWNQA